MKKIKFSIRILRVSLAMALIMSATAVAAEDDLVLRVAEKQTLIQIGLEYLENPGDWRELARINNLKNVDLIHPGQEIVIPYHLLKKKPLTGEVSFIKGHVLRRSAGKDWEPLRAGDRLLEGDEIKTGEDGGVEIKYMDETTVLLRSGTEIEIKKSRLKSDETFMRVIFLKIGRIITKLRRATGKESRYIIETPSAVAAARGTRYRVRGDRETTFTEVLDGAVRVGAMDKYVDLKENEGSRVKKGAAPEPARKLLSPPRPIDMLGQYGNFPVSIRFSKIDEAVLYRCMLARDMEMKNVALVSEIKPDGALEIPELPDGAYYLHSNSVDAIGLESAPSEVATFKIRTNPKPPEILSPGGLFGSFRGKEAPLQWRGAPDAVKHHVVIAKDWHFENIVYDNNDVTGDSIKIELPGGGTYFLKISGIAADGHEGKFGKWKSFRLKAPPPPPPAPAAAE